jgi:hypothetical protein
MEVEVAERSDGGRAGSGDGAAGASSIRLSWSHLRTVMCPIRRKDGLGKRMVRRPVVRMTHMKNRSIVRPARSSRRASHCLPPAPGWFKS